ncbi:uncharacterized protein [Canis lupus baileyi]|uniref:translation initiation factor IF-2-like n=1 Tax=Canis lupus dingo TaxID=286419 RepID=UPI0020C3D69B|nr:translation initiation factor IF-2-like [Canis lupus dingo]
MGASGAPAGLRARWEEGCRAARPTAGHSALPPPPPARCHTPLPAPRRYLRCPGVVTRAGAVAVADAQVVDRAVEQHRGPVEAWPVRGPVALGVVAEQELADDGRLAHARGAQHGHPQAAPHGPRALPRPAPESLMGQPRALPRAPCPARPAPAPGEARPEGGERRGQVRGRERSGASAAAPPSRGRSVPRSPPPIAAPARGAERASEPSLPEAAMRLLGFVSCLDSLGGTKLSINQLSPPSLLAFGRVQS